MQPLSTEGQGFAEYPDRKVYKLNKFNFPFGVGVKYDLGSTLSLRAEFIYRNTNTDYLDDVSTTYVGANKFTPLSTAALLQDRSVEIDPVNPLGVEGRQRGWSKQKDQYIIAEIGITYNLSTYRCPTAY